MQAVLAQRRNSHEEAITLPENVAEGLGLPADYLRDVVQRAAGSPGKRWIPKVLKRSLGY